MDPNPKLDLLSTVLHAYSKESDGVLDNAALYEKVAQSIELPAAEATRRQPVGESGEKHNLFHRRVRWQQQTLKDSGILEHVEGHRGVWRLTKPAAKDLNRIGAGVSVVGFSTDLGIAILGSCDSVFSSIDAPITLVVTSPPYPLASARKYGNPSLEHYVDWICKMVEPLIRNLVPGGVLTLNVSNDIFVPGTPVRSNYRERLVIALEDRFGLSKVDEFIWENPSKPPGPLQWASLTRQQLNVAWEPVYAFTNDPYRLKSNNRRVLMEHTERHLQLIAQGGENRDAVFSDGAYRVHHGSFGNETEGRIPRNVLKFGHRCAEQSAYKRMAREAGLPVHGAPMPIKLAEFFIKFFTEPGDLVVDPFGGSFTTAHAAERLGRRWLSTEVMLEYVLGGALRFDKYEGYRLNLPMRDEPESNLVLF